MTNPRPKYALALAICAGSVVVGMVIATWLGSAPGPPTPARDEPGRRDRERLQGGWEAVSLVRDGREVVPAGGARVRFEGDAVTFVEADVALRGAYTLDATRRPKTLDLIVTDGDAPRATTPGIYDLKGEMLWLCFAFTSSVRPEDFVAFPGSGRTLIVCRRESDGRAGRRGILGIASGFAVAFSVESRAGISQAAWPTLGTRAGGEVVSADAN
jgi:uncharacterized protein (TIGR03067 family)